MDSVFCPCYFHLELTVILCSSNAICCCGFVFVIAIKEVAWSVIVRGESKAVRSGTASWQNKSWGYAVPVRGMKNLQMDLKTAVIAYDPKCDVVSRKTDILPRQR